MRWLIFEDALKDKRGHYFEYISTFKRGLEACGDEVAIFTDKTAEPWIENTIGSTPALPRCIWRRMSDNAPRWKRLLRYPWHGWHTFLAWRRILKSTEGADVVFVPSVSTHHLFGIVPFLRLFGGKIPGTVLLFFPNNPIRHNPDRGEPALNAEPTARLFPWLLRGLKPLLGSGKVLLGAETHSMKDALERLTGLPFHYLPHPVNAMQVSPDTDLDWFGVGEKDTIVFGSYGGCRCEKGSDLLQSAVAKYLADRPDPRVRFAIQWTGNFADAAGNPVNMDAWLPSHPQVIFITDYFDPAGGYARALKATSVMLLPYRDSYRYRLSRVVIEAMIEGIPVAVSEDTTLAEQAATHGAYVSFAQNSVDSIVRAIKECVRRHEELRQEASSKAAACAEHFSVARFRASLVEAMQCAVSSSGPTMHC